MHLIAALVSLLLLTLYASGKSCKDKSTYCQFWKDNDYCTRTYVTYMRKNCPKTCGFCSVATKAPAKVQTCMNVAKHNRNCEQYWKQFCVPSSQHWGFMKANCKKTCGLCKSKSKRSVDCQDDPQQRSRCANKKAFGHCKQASTQFKWMHKHCAKTCKFCRDDCGLRGSAAGKVIGGVEAEAHSWPWSVALLRFGSYFCGGSLIDEQWVLTAAHCVYGREQQAAYMTAVLGEHDRTINEGSELKMEIEKIISHKDYSSITLDSDIAMIKLKKKVTLKKDALGNPVKIGLVCLPKQGETQKLSNLCYITGWGKTKHPGPSSTILMEAEMPPVSNAVCKRQNSQWGGTKITKKMICGGQEPGTIISGCHGDSGGPFVCNRSKNRWTLTGVVSWGSSECKRSEKYTVFARVSEFRDWIDNIRHTN